MSTATLAPSRARMPASEAGSEAGGRARLSPRRVLLFLGAHVILAVLVNQSDVWTQAHAALVIGAGIWSALAGRHRNTVYILGYIFAAEVLWRMRGGDFFYEQVKYAALLIMALSVLRMRGGVRLRWLPLVFALLLFPSISVTLDTFPPGTARDQISFNLAGPIACAGAFWYFLHLRLGRRELRRILVAMLGPLVAIAYIALDSTLAAGVISFTDESNFTTSGGFGPNQVSSVLAFGALLAAFQLFDSKGERWWRWLMLATVLGLGTQSALTFSRGGLYTAGGAAVVGLLLLFRDRRIRARIISGALVVYAVVSFFVLPRLESFTGGALVHRFQQHTVSTRMVFMRAELRAFREHPFLGVGPGGGKVYRIGDSGIPSAPHTEITRLLAEHGFLGVLAILVAGAMALQALRRQTSVPGRAWSAALLVWAVLYTMHSATRLAMPALAVGLAAARLWYDQGDDRRPRAAAGAHGRTEGRGATAAHV